MNDSSRTQGGLICIGVVIVAAWFLLGLLQGSYWALAIPAVSAKANTNINMILFFISRTS